MKIGDKVRVKVSMVGVECSYSPKHDIVVTERNIAQLEKFVRNGMAVPVGTFQADVKVRSEEKKKNPDPVPNETSDVHADTAPSPKRGRRFIVSSGRS